MYFDTVGLIESDIRANKSSKELDKKLSGKSLIWLFSAELIQGDCSGKIQNEFLILEISHRIFCWHKLNLHTFWDGCDINGFLANIFVDLSPKDQPVSR